MTDKKRKAAIMSVATTLIGSGAVKLLGGSLYTGGALLLAGAVLTGLYEVYQVRQLPEGLGEDDVRQIAEEVADQTQDAVQENDLSGGS